MCLNLSTCPIPILISGLIPNLIYFMSHSHSHSSRLTLNIYVHYLISCLIPRPLWCCSHCNNPYNRDHIEQSLIDAVQRRSMSVVLQDLVCTKCQGVRQTYLDHTSLVPRLPQSGTRICMQYVYAGRAWYFSSFEHDVIEFFRQRFACYSTNFAFNAQCV